MKKHWMMGLAAASMAVLLAGCGNNGNVDDDGMVSGGDMSSGMGTHGTSNSGGTDTSTPATGGNASDPDVSGGNGAPRGILPDGNGNMPGFQR